MKRQRRTHLPEFKAKVALAAIQGGMTMPELVKKYDLLVAKARILAGLSRRLWYGEDPAKAQLEQDTPGIGKLNGLVDRHPRWGFWK